MSFASGLTGHRSHLDYWQIIKIIWRKQLLDYWDHVIVWWLAIKISKRLVVSMKISLDVLSSAAVIFGTCFRRLSASEKSSTWSHRGRSYPPGDRAVWQWRCLYFPLCLWERACWCTEHSSYPTVHQWGGGGRTGFLQPTGRSVYRPAAMGSTAPFSVLNEWIGALIHRWSRGPIRNKTPLSWNVEDIRGEEKVKEQKNDRMV